MQGSKVILKPVETDQLIGTYLGWLRDSDVTRYLEARFTDYTVERLRSYIETENGRPNAVFFGIHEAGTNNFIGTIKLSQIRPEHRHCEIGLMIGDRSVWGKGCGAEAITLASRYAFEELGLHKVAAGCYGNNLGSARAFLKAGFEIEGRLREDRWSCEGWVDKLWLGLINPAEKQDRKESLEART